jgi:hypothetical protein
MRELVQYQCLVQKREARAGIEPAIEVLQTTALPLGYLAVTLVTSGGFSGMAA